MKIITWNCNGALRKKLDFIDSFDADVLVIQECENPVESSKDYLSWAGKYLWKGTNKNKGIGIFAKNGVKLEALNWEAIYEIHTVSWKSCDLELFLPCLINGKIPLLGVWTKSPNGSIFDYIGQFWIYLQMFKSEMAHDEQIICGDFNSNSMWDKKDRWWNHSNVIKELEDLGLHSLYHYHKNEEQGKESQETFFLQKNKNKNYHIDYVFLKNKILGNSKIEVLEPDMWLAYSDHAPILFEVSY